MNDVINSEALRNSDRLTQNSSVTSKAIKNNELRFPPDYSLEEDDTLCILYYKTDKAEITEEHKESLSTLKNKLADKTWIATIDGFASCEGDPTYNKLLSQRRRDEVINYLFNNDQLDVIDRVSGEAKGAKESNCRRGRTAQETEIIRSWDRKVVIKIESNKWRKKIVSLRNRVDSGLERLNKRLIESRRIERELDNKLSKLQDLDNYGFSGLSELKMTIQDLEVQIATYSPVSDRLWTTPGDQYGYFDYLEWADRYFKERPPIKRIIESIENTITKIKEQIAKAEQENPKNTNYISFLNDVLKDCELTLQEVIESQRDDFT